MTNSTTDVVVHAEKLGFQSGQKFLLRDVSWTVKKGEHWVVFGMNGSGKTTLLSIIAGFKKHTHGDLEVFGETFEKNNVLYLRKRIGWVSSSFFDRYFSEESALNIVLSGLFGTFGIDFEIADADVVLAKNLLKRFGLEDKLDRPYSMMSKGERQNVLIARALIAQPEILLLDEPGTGLDVFAREAMLSAVQELATSLDITVVYVTHYLEEVVPLFEHCILLKNGRVYAKGRTDVLLTTEKLTKFLDYPAQIKNVDGKYFIDLSVRTDVATLLKGGVKNV